ncbi:hypothetical protein [Arenimonas oryziterrae]|uniref:DUF3185 domain-containing protein n=1 Tax=Arenimonas oryziterrae DSM 21050 = YC6267 TaxID=1121015 RepID=A0A091BIE1_9GAMM|nr:hypothetical protein [Arenimonas oryziterrae]KFN44120.1 hypothetical protein N789_06810 [Arenimonas oryziterrae DSM 21050 = YC6267]
MRKPALIVGILLLIAGALIAAGVFKIQTTEKVADIGPIEISKTDTKKPPLNLGYILLGVGALVVVVGAVAKK